MTVAPGQKVRVYRNLHKDLWSLVATSGPERGRVVAHAQQLSLANPVLTVQEGGRQRALFERQRNIHAFVVGVLLAENERPAFTLHQVRYNPFRAPCFTDPAGNCVLRGRLAVLDQHGHLWLDNPAADSRLLLARTLGRMQAELRGQGVSDQAFAAWLATNRNELLARLRRVEGGA